MPNFSDPNVREKCESWHQSLKSTDLKFVTPVTNIATKITYANEYCALCNDDENFVTWNTSYDCYTSDSETTESDVNLDAKTNSFYKNFGSNGTRAFCYQKIMPPPEVEPLLRRICKRNVVGTCPNTTVDKVTVDLCKSFTSIVYDDRYYAYKNKHCAACNGIKNPTNCIFENAVPYTAFSTVFSVNDKAVGVNNPCESTDEAIKAKFCTQ